MSDYSAMSDADLMALVQPKAAPSDFSKMSDADLMARIQGKQSNPVGDFFKSIPRGVMSGVSHAASALGAATQAEMGQMDEVRPTAEQGMAAMEKNVTGPLHQPEGRAGKFGAAVGEGLGNPVSYLGPGSVALKVGGSVLSSLGGEGGRQAAEGTKYETAAQLGGAALGGVAGVKSLGSVAEKAAIPTAAELKSAKNAGYDKAIASGLELHPQGVGQFASKVEQELATTHAHTGGQFGTAPQTFSVLENLQSNSAGAVVTAANIDSIRKNLGRIAGETKDFKPTPDAHAATIALKNLRDYVENLPQGHILAGDAAAYNGAIKQANGDYAALSRVRDFDTRLTKAENATDRQIAGSLDAQIKSKAGSMLDNPSKLRGLNGPERAQLQLINSGGPVSNTLRQLGRGGAGVIPLGAQIATGVATGGALLPYQVALAASLYGARKGSEAITKNRANILAEMLAKRSPEYERRAANAAPADTPSNIAALARALIAH